MHKKIRFPGRMIVTQTISRKDGFTSMITNFDQNQSTLHILFTYVDSLITTPNYTFCKWLFLLLYNNIFC